MLTALVVGAVVVALLWPKPQPKRGEGGYWVPRSVGKVTARQWAVIDKAHRSTDPDQVLSAYYLAKSLGFDDPAEVLSQRHAALVMKRQAEYPPPPRSIEDED